MLGTLGKLGILVKLCCLCENISIINLFNRITIEFVILVLFRLVCLYPELVCIYGYFGMHFPYVREEFLLRKSKGGHGPYRRPIRLKRTKTSA